MGEIFSVLLAFPAVFFTVLTSLAIIYWLFVVIGALDIDSLGGAAGAGKGAFEGAAKGAMEGAAGAAKGAMEGAAGAAKGAFEGAAGAAKGAMEGAAGAAKGAFEGAAEGIDLDGDLPEGADAGLLAFLRLRDAPVTVVGSFFSLFGLVLTGFYGLNFGIPGVMLGIPILLGATALSLVMTSFAIRPLAPMFREHKAKSSQDFVGKIATISTGRVSDRFGQANLDDGGAGLIIEIRSDGQNKLKRGDRVVLVHWDTAKEAFEVEKLPDDAAEARIATDALNAAEEELEVPPEARGSGRA